MAIIVVAASGGDYTTIENALSNPATVNNDIIQVDPGIYSPTGTIGLGRNLTGITISGSNDDAGQVIINASNISGGAAAATITASAGWTLQNFSILNSNPGIDYPGSGTINASINNTITNIIISGSSGIGINDIGTDSIVEQCQIMACTGSGIESANAPNNTGIYIRSCLVFDCGTNNGRDYGIVLWASGTISHNTVVNCTGIIGLGGVQGTADHNIVAMCHALAGYNHNESGGGSSSYNLAFGTTHPFAPGGVDFGSTMGIGDQDSGDVPDETAVFHDEENNVFILGGSSPARLASTGSGITSYRDLNRIRYAFHSASKGCYSVNITDTTAPTWSTDPPTITIAAAGDTSLRVTWTAATDNVHANNFEYLATLFSVAGDGVTQTEVSTTSILAPTQINIFSSLSKGTTYAVRITPVDAAENSGSGYSVTASTNKAWTHEHEGGNNPKTNIPATDYVITSIALDRKQWDTETIHNSSTNVATAPIQFSRRGPISLRRSGLPYSCSLGG